MNLTIDRQSVRRNLHRREKVASSTSRRTPRTPRRARRAKTKTKRKKKRMRHRKKRKNERRKNWRRKKKGAQGETRCAEERTKKRKPGFWFRFWLITYRGVIRFLRFTYHTHMFMLHASRWPCLKYISYAYMGVKSYHSKCPTSWHCYWHIVSVGGGCETWNRDRQSCQPERQTSERATWPQQLYRYWYQVESRWW